jgi:hypothetical protein
MTQTAGRNPLDYQTVPLELLDITDLTDALGVELSAGILNTTKRSIYTVRNTNVLGIERRTALINAVRSNEANCRQRLVVLRQRQREKDARRARITGVNLGAITNA